MSHTGIKTAAVILALTSVPVFTQWSANESMRREIAATHEPSAAKLSRAAPPGDRSSTEIEIAALQRELAAQSELLRISNSSRQNAEERVADLQRQMDRLTNEVVVSLGTIDGMAHRLGRMIARLPALKAAQDYPASPDKQRQMNEEMAAAIGDVWEIGRAAQKLEHDPAKAARFYATMLSEVIQFDPVVRAQCEKYLVGGFEKVRAGGLAGPAPRQEDFYDWREGRQTFFQEMRTGLLQLLETRPPDSMPLPDLLEAVFDVANPPFHFEGGAPVDSLSAPDVGVPANSHSK
jgi:hypothetical protein